MSTAEKREKYTLKEYFELDENAEFHYEYHNGDVFAMAGGSFNHGLISGNILTALNLAIGDRGCFVTPSDVKCGIKAENSYVHPDVMVVCGELEFEENRNDTILNPTVIIEVLSESTASYDQGSKFRKYRTLDSLREYILVEQKMAMVNSFYKNDNGLWTIGDYSESEKEVKIHSLDISISIDDIYKKVTFPPQKPKN